MATVVGNLRVLLSADAAEFTRDVKRAERALMASADRMGKAGEKLRNKVTLPLLAVGAASAKLAADAAESASKFETVFGSAAGEMTSFIRDVQSSIPATRKELQDMTSGLQDLLVPMGVIPRKAVEMNQSFVRLAGDLASFNNLRITDVLNDLRSGIVGQSEPLLKYGIDVRAAAVKTKAFEMGLISAGGEMTNAARAQAVLAIATEQSTFALGDAARTSGSAANQFKFLWRDLKEIGTEIGKILLPVVIDLLRQLNGLLRAARDLDPWVLKLGISFGVLAAAVGPLLISLSSLLQLAVALRGATALAGLAALLTPGGALLGGLALLAGGFALASARTKGLTADTREYIGELETLRGMLASMSQADLGVVLARNSDDLQAVRAELAETEAKIAELAAGPKVVRGVRVQPQIDALTKTLDDLQAKERELLGTHRDIVASFGRFQQSATAAATATTGLTEGTKAAGEQADFTSRKWETWSRILDEYRDGMLEIDRVQRETLSRSAMVPESLASAAKSAVEMYEKITERSRETNLAQQIAEFSRIEQAARSMAESVGAAFEDFIMGTKDLLSAVRDMVTGILSELLRLAIQRAITVPLMNSIMSAFGGGGPLVPGLATGGPVAAGRPYLVGEKGPELFVPSTAGQVVPNGAFGGQQVVNHQTIQFNLSAIDSRGLAGLVRQNRKLFSDAVADRSHQSAIAARRLRG